MPRNKNDALRRNVFHAIEERLSDRGLKFEDRGLGFVPVQAFGRIDGQRFYFRFRGDTASLTVGTFDEALELAEWLWRKENDVTYGAQLTAEDANHLMFGMLIAQSNRTLETDLNFIPTRVTAWAVADDVTGEPYNGSLELDEFATLFERLVSELVPVPEDEQIESIVISNLTEAGLWPLTAASTERNAMCNPNC
jgi:hypothetical protein